MTDMADRFKEWEALRVWQDGKPLHDKHRFAIANSIAQLRAGSPTGDEEILACVLGRLLSDEALSEEDTSLLEDRLTALKL